MENGKIFTAMAAIIILGVIVPRVRAASQEERIARLEAQLAAIQQELELLKRERLQSAPPAVDEQAINAAVDRAVAEKMAQQPTVPDWVSNIALSGDFRYRHEWTDDDTRTAKRNRHRIQARIGLYGTVNDEVGYGFRLASGNAEAPLREGSPTSNNQDLGNAFSSKNIWLDLAYFDYHPKAIAGLNVYGGKINNPYYRVGNSDLLFDSDVTPEGIAVAYKTNVSETVNIFGAAGGYYVRERRESADTSLWGVQGGTTLKFGDDGKSHLTAGAGYYNYGNVKGRRGLGSDETQFYGNRETDGRFDSDFDLVQGFAEAGIPAGELPLRFFGDYICNTRAASGHDAAYLIGAGLGRTTAPGTWAVSYNYRDVEADALLGVLAEAAFGGGGTDIRGHKFGFDYQLARNTRFGLTYMTAKRTRNNETNDFDVTMVDFTFRF